MMQRWKDVSKTPAITKPTLEGILALLDLTGPARNLRPRYNIAPTTEIDVARLGTAGRELVPMRWGLIPSWWKKPLSELPATFNARAETVAEKAQEREPDGD
jgi:putative SOS response-associated peptidase YedK